MIATKTYAEIQDTEMMVVGAWARKSRYGDRITFGCFLVYLFSAYLLLISARYKWRRHGFYHLPLEVEFPRAPDPPKGSPVRYRSVAGLIRLYEHLHTTFV